MKTRIKKTYICKNILDWYIQQEIPVFYKPQVGDVGIFEVLTIGKHERIQNDSKRNASIIEKDLIMAAFGTRYATAQLEGYLPESINGELHILGAGGTIGIVESMHDKFLDVGPTKLRMKGLVTDKNGVVYNTKQIMNSKLLAFTGAFAPATKVILSLGSSMDSGKTTSAAYLVRGLKEADLNVAYVKLTGTVYTKDSDLAWDMGADMVADFGDYGFPSTYLCERDELLSLYESLVCDILGCNPDYVIIELADGLYQRETHMLLSDSIFRSTIYGVIYSAADSLAAIDGVQVLEKWGIRPLFICGLLTASPLLIKEVKEYTDIPVFKIEELAFGNSLIEMLSENVTISNLA